MGLTGEGRRCKVQASASSGASTVYLEVLAKHEVQRAAEVLAKSFEDYPIWAYIQPKSQRRVKLLTWVLSRYIRGLMSRSGKKRGYAYALRDTCSSNVAGVVLLWRPKGQGCGSRELQTWQLVRQGLIALPFKFGFGVTHRLLRADAGEDKEKLHLALALGAYWYLDYLAVDSTMQSRGLGTRALHTCIKLAQAEVNCPVLVNTCSEAARAFYLRNGFQELGQQPVLIGDSKHWWMAYPAQNPAVL